MIYHNYNGLTLHIFVIGFAAAADALSWDAWRNRGSNWLTKGLAKWQYGMPVILICTATVVTYALSGLAKVWSELAWDWAQGTAMRSQVASDSIRKIMLGGEAEPLFGWLFNHTWIFMGMGVMTYLLELGAPLALLHRKIAYGWVSLTLGMHWGIYFIMGIDFPYQLSGFVFLSFYRLKTFYG
ncbi:MAG: hypothetical protein HC817_05345 [Saprospiraceae bacterium]|nr:hypothetical protein [Saprospiraceae bacterium]